MDESEFYEGSDKKPYEQRKNELYMKIKEKKKIYETNQSSTKGN